MDVTDASKRLTCQALISGYFVLNTDCMNLIEPRASHPNPMITNTARFRPVAVFTMRQKPRRQSALLPAPHLPCNHAIRSLFLFPQNEVKRCFRTNWPHIW